MVNYSVYFIMLNWLTTTSCPPTSAPQLEEPMVLTMENTRVRRALTYLDRRRSESASVSRPNLSGENT